MINFSAPYYPARMGGVWYVFYEGKPLFVAKNYSKAEKQANKLNQSNLFQDVSKQERI